MNSHPTVEGPMSPTETPSATAANGVSCGANRGLPPLLVGAKEAARLCGVSPATWARMKSAGRLPACLWVSKRVLWRVEELREWVEAGCPDRKAWDAMRDARKRGTR
jgi:hypothetical protein